MLCNSRHFFTKNLGNYGINHYLCTVLTHTKNTQKTHKKHAKNTEGTVLIVHTAEAASVASAAFFWGKVWTFQE